MRICREKGRFEGEGGSLSVHKEILSGKGALNKILDTSSSSHSCIRVAMTLGVLVEVGRRHGWGLAEAIAARTYAP